MPRRELLLIGEMIDAAEQAQSLVSGRDVEAIVADRQVRDALLWNSPFWVRPPHSFQTSSRRPTRA